MQLTCITEHRLSKNTDQDVLTSRIVGQNKNQPGKQGWTWGFTEVLHSFLPATVVMKGINWFCIVMLFPLLLNKLREETATSSGLSKTLPAGVSAVSIQWEGKLDSSSLGAKTNVTDWSPNNTTRTKSSSYRNPNTVYGDYQLSFVDCCIRIAIQPARQQRTRTAVDVVALFTWKEENRWFAADPRAVDRNRTLFVICHVLSRDTSLRWIPISLESLHRVGFNSPVLNLACRANSTMNAER